MKDTRIARFCGLLLCLSLSLLPTAGSTEGRQLDRRTVIAASTVLDGRGGIARNTRVVVSAGKIVAVDPTASPVDIDLGRATLTPGWIDTHVHLTWHYNEQGKSVSGGEPQEIAQRAAAENARLTI
jgi:imidazolonepropionase-like amidohydrolase